MTTILADLLKDSAYRLDQFQPAAIAALEAAVTLKTSAKAATPYVNCMVRSKPIKLTPEEAVRQLYLYVLHKDLGYLREVAIVLPGDELPCIASTEFIVLRSKNARALGVEALMVYLRSHLPQIVFKWSQDGSNHPRFDERELLNLPVPRALIADQAGYQAAVVQMVMQRQHATRLLDAAKRAVKIAIEDSEAAALAFLEAVA